MILPLITESLTVTCYVVQRGRRWKLIAKVTIIRYIVLPDTVHDVHRSGSISVAGETKLLFLRSVRVEIDVSVAFFILVVDVVNWRRIMR